MKITRIFRQPHLWLLTSLLGMLAVSVTAQAKDKPNLLQQIEDRGSINIGIEGTYPPFNYRDEKGHLTGYEVEFARALAKELGVKANFVLTEWAGMLAGLDSKRLDVAINQVIITPTREKKYDFSDPYTLSGLQILSVAGGLEADKPEDLVGKRVGVGLGTDHEEWLREHVPDAKVETYQDNATELQDLKVGRIDAIVNDRLMMGYLTKRSKGHFYAGKNLFKDQAAGVAMRKGNPELLHAINQAIEHLKDDGKLAKISDKWFGTDVSKR